MIARTVGRVSAVQPNRVRSRLSVELHPDGLTRFTTDFITFSRDKDTPRRGGVCDGHDSVLLQLTQHPFNRGLDLFIGEPGITALGGHHAATWAGVAFDSMLI